MKKYLQYLLGTDKLLEELQRLSNENKTLNYRLIDLDKKVLESVKENNIEKLLSTYFDTNINQMLQLNNHLKEFSKVEHKVENTEILQQVKLTEKLIFNKIDTNQFNKVNNDFSLITSNEKSSGLLNLSAFTISNALIGKQIIKGLYSTTANPETLVKYASGLYSSMTTQGGKIASHNGFKPVSINVLGPMFVFQALTIVTSQVHMRDINNQLIKINSKLTDLMKFHKYERISRLKFINNKLTEYQNRSFFTIEDFVLIEHLKYDLLVIKEESFSIFGERINRIFEESNKQVNSNIKAENNNKSINGKSKFVINIESAFLATKSTFNDFSESSYNKFNNMIIKIKENEIFTYAEFSLTAEKLYENLLMIELIANLKVKDLNQDRIGKIDELKQNLINYLNEEKVLYEIKPIFNQFKNDFSQFKAKKFNNAFKKNKNEIDNAEKQFYSSLEFLESLLDSNIELSIDNLLNSFNDEYEIIIDINDEVENVYMKKI